MTSPAGVAEAGGANSVIVRRPWADSIRKTSPIRRPRGGSVRFRYTWVMPPRRRSAAGALPKSAPEAGGSGARERAVLAAALDPILTIDVAGVVQSASDSVERVFGWSPTELIGRNISVLMPEPHRSAHDGYLARYHATGVTNIMNRARRFEAVRRDGTVFPMELSVSRADMPGQAAPLFVGIIRDLTERPGSGPGDGDQARVYELLAEQTTALQTAHLRLRMADRMASIGALAAGLGHDMNNVLLPVRARLNALKAGGERGGLAAADLRHVAAIAKSLSYLQQLADGLHYLALDPEAGDTDLGATDMREWWSQVGPLLSKAVPKHVKVSVSLPAGLPGVRVSSHGLTQAMLNLVVNAGEAVPEHRKRRQGSVRIWARAVEGGGSVRLGVTDNGRGMSDDVRRRAFEMFFTTKPRGMGTGLGLSLVRRVVDRAGGSMEIESEPGVGTTVVLNLPVTGARMGGSAGMLGIITLSDGRAGAMIRHLLEGGGIRAEVGADPADAAIWVTQATGESLARAKRWRAGRPDGKLVLLGEPGAGAKAAWGALGPLTIADRDNLDEIRAVLARAMAGS